MINSRKKVLKNGLRVLTHYDETTPLVTVNLMYQVGSRDERNDRTGFAHLFEHLMFGGTRQNPDFDAVVDALEGESNAYTNNDYTNYYITVPREYLREALALEADRMRGDWDIAAESRWEVLEVQQKVVTEEYHQRYLNQPYGDTWMLLRPMCYRKHPYRWCTIGADIRHVQEATLDDVRAFFQQYYRPENAILAIAGGVPEDEATALAEELMGDIAGSGKPEEACNRTYPSEPQQTAQMQTVERPVPNNAIYKAWVMCDRWNRDYYAYDMVSDLLSNGHSSRMYRRLVQEQGLFCEVDAYITGDLGPGLFVVSGKLRDGVSFEQAGKAIEREIQLIAEEPVDARELEKVANKFENTFVYSQYKASDRALSICYFEMIGDPQLANDEPAIYHQITPADIQRVANRLLGAHAELRIKKSDGRQS